MSGIWDRQRELIEQSQHHFGGQYPYDYVTTQGGQNWLEKRGKEDLEEWKKKPRGKRIEWDPNVIWWIRDFSSLVSKKTEEKETETETEIKSQDIIMNHLKSVWMLDGSSVDIILPFLQSKINKNTDIHSILKEIQTKMNLEIQKRWMDFNSNRMDLSLALIKVRLESMGRGVPTERATIYSVNLSNWNNIWKSRIRAIRHKKRSSSSSSFSSLVDSFDETGLDTEENQRILVSI